MAISQISLRRYLQLLARDDVGPDHTDLGRAWFASKDACVLGRIWLNPASHLWDAVALLGVSSGWAEVEVNPHEFATARSAEAALLNFMESLISQDANCHEGTVHS